MAPIEIGQAVTMTQLYNCLYLQVNPTIFRTIRSNNENDKVPQKVVQNSKSHHVNNNNNHPHKIQSSSQSSNKHVCKTGSNNDQVHEVTGQTLMLEGKKSETEDTIDHHNS